MVGIIILPAEVVAPFRHDVAMDHQLNQTLRRLEQNNSSIQSQQRRVLAINGVLSVIPSKRPFVAEKRMEIGLRLGRKQIAKQNRQAIARSRYLFIEGAGG